jgi:phage head maturation protease
MPLGRAESITADSKGLLTVTRYNKTSQAEEVLEAIKSGSLTSQSFTGPIRQSTPSLSRSQRRMGGYRPNSDGSLQLVRRMELGLIEYGPTPLPAYQGAAIVGVRSMLFTDQEEPDEDQASDALDESANGLDPEAVRSTRLQRRIRAALTARERADS